MERGDHRDGRGHGSRCGERDALDPNMLRDRVKTGIRTYLDLNAWERCRATEQAEQQSRADVFGRDPLVRPDSQEKKVGRDAGPPASGPGPRGAARTWRRV